MATKGKAERQYGNGFLAVTGYVPPRIKQRFKVKAARSGQSMSERVAELIREDLKRK